MHKKKKKKGWEDENVPQKYFRGGTNRAKAFGKFMGLG
jgi:hypothetical protein